MKTLPSLSFLILCLCFAACSNVSDPKSPLVIPSSYEAPTWSTTASAQLQVIADIEELVEILEAGRSSGTRIDRAAASAVLVRVSRLLSPAALVEVSTLVDLAIESSGNSYDPMLAPSASTKGGVYGAYLYNKYGIDATEVIEKHLFSSLLYLQATAYLNAATVSADNVDKALACFGASPVFSNSDKVSNAPDVFCAAYAARRDKADGLGLYAQIKKQFITALTAAKAGNGYTDEYYHAVSLLRGLWEKSQMATCINYCYATISGLSATDLTEATRSSAMHAYGEAVGFAIGWRSVPATSRLVSDADLDEVLQLLQVPNGAPYTCENVWQQSVITLPKLEAATKKLQLIYGFTDSQMLDFRQNWVNVQGRK